MTEVLSSDQKVKRIMRIIPARLREGGFEGCTEADLDELKRSQNVICIPEVYRRLMLVMGMKGINRIFEGSATCHDLITERSKKKLAYDLDEEIGLPYPQDIFVFAEDGERFFFFRTSKCQEDPPIYAFWYENYFHKLADSISEYFLEVIRESNEAQEKLRARTINDVDFYYDRKQDTFYGVRPFPYDDPLLSNEIMEFLRSQYEGKTIGCTEKELDDLKQAQKVAHLPEVYQQFLLLLGAQGVNWIMGEYEKPTTQLLKVAKKTFISKIENLRINYPQDIFVFLTGYGQKNFLFFRTEDCQEDPPVYGYFEGYHFIKMADSVSQFFLQETDPSQYRRNERWEKRRQAIYCYDIPQAKFVQCLMPIDNPSS